jgi:hypothetical protein
MKRVTITGEAVASYRQTIEVPDDEIEDLLRDEENLKVNVDGSAPRDVIYWEWIKAEVQ